MKLCPLSSLCLLLGSQAPVQPQDPRMLHIPTVPGQNMRLALGDVLPCRSCWSSEHVQELSQGQVLTRAGLPLGSTLNSSQLPTPLGKHLLETSGSLRALRDGCVGKAQIQVCSTSCCAAPEPGQSCTARCLIH